MAYTQSGKIEASDFNTFRANTNTVWSQGVADSGYGQASIASVGVSGKVQANNWSTLTGRIVNIAAHQGTTISSMDIPTVGDSVDFIPNLTNNITTINTNRLNAVAQGTSSANTVTRGSTWTQYLSFMHTVTFANGDAARNFFNSGGQLKITVSHANSTAGINSLFNKLASDTGTVVISSAASVKTATIAGITYHGITKVGGGGKTPFINDSFGYYGIPSSPMTIGFLQEANSGPIGYQTSTIDIGFQTNGTQGANADNGNILTIETYWNEDPTGLVVGSGSATTLTVVYPSTTYLANTWGTVSVSGSVTGA